jgi:hypothetical protein
MNKTIFRITVALITFLLGVATVALFAMDYYAPLEETYPVRSAHLLNIPTPPVKVSREGAQTEPQPRRSKYLKAIEIRQGDEDHPIQEMIFENTATKVINIDLDLGDNIENQKIVLRPHDGETREFKIEQQFETSFQVHNEGPHIDLKDWKHYRSNWEEIRAVEKNVFLTPKLREADHTKFPQVTRTEIYNAVFNAGGREWAQKTRRCQTLTDSYCNVGVSRISYRIMVKESGQWKVINQLNFDIPMGC